MNSADYKAIAEIIKDRLECCLGDEAEDKIEELANDFADYFEKEDKKIKNNLNKHYTGLGDDRDNKFNRAEFLKLAGADGKWRELMEND